MHVLLLKTNIASVGSPVKRTPKYTFFQPKTIKIQLDVLSECSLLLSLLN